MPLLCRFVLILGMLFLAVGGAAATEFRLAADNLMKTLSWRVTCVGSDPVQIGIWPFDESDIPVGSANAYRIYSAFLADLFLTKPQCVEFLDGDGVNANITYLNKVGAFSAAGRKPLDVIETNLRNVDFYIAGTLIEQAGEVFAVFKLIDSKSGATLASSPSMLVPGEFVDQKCGDGAISIDAAMSAIGDAFASQAPAMRDLIVEGGYFENSQARTEFGRYLETLISGRIVAAFDNVLSGRRLLVHALHANVEGPLFKIRGLDIVARELDPRVYEVGRSDPSAEDEAYLLTFRYWLCDKRAKLQVLAKSRSGSQISWAGSVRLDDLPENIALSPPSPTETRHWGPDGAFTFDMTSQRGLNPTFRPGELFEVLFRLERDAWLYCFYTDAEGATIQVLPNPYSRGINGSNFYAGGKLHLFPDSNRVPAPDHFQLKVNARTNGIEVFECIATSRNVEQQLPEALSGSSLDPLPATYSARLREIFEAVDDKAMSAARMTVTVMEQRP